MSGIKRSTTYLALGGLRAKGLAISQKSGAGGPFQPRSPYALLESHRELETSLSGLVTKLIALNSNFLDQPKISLSSGVPAIERSWSEMLEQGKEILFWADSSLAIGRGQPAAEKKLRELNEGTYVSTYRNERISKQIWVRGIFPYEGSARNLAKLGLADRQAEYLNLKRSGPQEFRELLCCPRADYPLSFELTLCGDSLWLISYYDLMVIRITHQALAETLKGIFHLCAAYMRERESSILSRKDRETLRL